MRVTENSNKLTTAGILLGFGLGGFIDKLTFRQLLHWHAAGLAEIPSSIRDVITVSLLWEGLIHALLWVVAAIGLAMLWSVTRRLRSQPSTRYLFGTMMLGWGLLNLIDGLINHFLLSLHSASETANSRPWNIGFLFIGGIVFSLVGRLMMKAGKRRLVPPRRSNLIH